MFCLVALSQNIFLGSYYASQYVNKIYFFMYQFLIDRIIYYYNLNKQIYCQYIAVLKNIELQ